MITRPVRERSKEKLVELTRELARTTLSDVLENAMAQHQSTANPTS